MDHLTEKVMVEDKTRAGGVRIEAIALTCSVLISLFSAIKRDVHKMKTHKTVSGDLQVTCISDPNPENVVHGNSQIA